MRLSQPTKILMALLVGLAAGIAAGQSSAPWVEQTASIAEPIGGLWLNALQMTIVPLVVSLLITGVAATARATRASSLAMRALILFAILLTLSALTAALLTPLFLDVFPLPSAAATKLRESLSSNASFGPVPGFSDFIRSIIPSNPIDAATKNSILPLIVFVLIFAFAMMRLPRESREILVNFFRAIADTMLVVIGWVLWIGPVGVFALAYVVGARAGGPVFHGLLHYIAIVTSVGAVVWLGAWLLVFIGARISPLRFTRAIASSLALAFSTQSSLACLPSMLRASSNLGVPVTASGVLLPLAVAVFRATGPAMNLAVAIYVAYWFGISLSPLQLALGVVVAALTTIGAAGIPGQATFFTSIGPICFAMGIPIEPLGLLIAVETLPDLMRTLGNVSMDVAVTTVVAKRGGFDKDIAYTPEDRLLKEDAKGV